MVLLDWPPSDHLWIGRNRGNSCPSQRATNAPRKHPLLDILALSPSCVSHTAQLKRESSPWPEFGWIPGNSHDLSKAYFATTFLSSSPTTPATQSGLPELGWKTLADIWRAGWRAHGGSMKRIRP